MQINLLDHGYIRRVEDWGYGDAKIAEAGIIEAARQSTQGSFRGWDKDMKLLQFMYSHQHATPFEFAGLIIEVQAPIAVFREWHRHRTQSYNEMSGRYTELPDLTYVPSIERLVNARQSTTNKQGSEEGFTLQQADDYQIAIRECGYHTRGVYERLLKAGVAREVARFVLPVNQYSRMRASANLRNWLAFMTLRMDPSAQWEIRQYANALYVIMKDSFPRTMELFDGGKHG